jgi:hypothetical protein
MIRAIADTLSKTKQWAMCSDNKVEFNIKGTTIVQNSIRKTWVKKNLVAKTAKQLEINIVTAGGVITKIVSSGVVPLWFCMNCSCSRLYALFFIFVAKLP